MKNLSLKSFSLQKTQKYLAKRDGVDLRTFIFNFFFLTKWIDLQKQKM